MVRVRPRPLPWQECLLCGHCTWQWLLPQLRVSCRPPSSTALWLPTTQPRFPSSSLTPYMCPIFLPLSLTTEFGGLFSPLGCSVHSFHGPVARPWAGFFREPFQPPPGTLPHHLGLFLSCHLLPCSVFLVPFPGARREAPWNQDIIGLVYYCISSIYFW